MQNTTQNTQQYFNTQAQAATELLNEATQAMVDYSTKAVARNVAFTRKIADRSKGFSLQKFWVAPADTSHLEESVKDAWTFASESVDELVQATDRNCDFWERAMTSAVEQTQTFLPPQADVYGKKTIDNIKAANNAVKDGVRAVGQATATIQPLVAKAVNGRKGKK